MTSFTSSAVWSAAAFLLLTTAAVRFKKALCTKQVKLSEERKKVNPDMMTIPQLKAWVLDNSLEDKEFYELCSCNRTRKTDWVKYVRNKLAAC